ncbi:hypothetical protein GCM10010387_46330 [Streptomyces inusitatus]|uniref:Uncharacterized protein n=1 Tax=Streptomyces inusitatus TaxID=68221 RepID=A0A918QGI3_9ACTN|nr:hypothetical protein [Streptomyces inusitatus]GGZ46614.1 hypothetical protein GCM10010387_46330 [Streptomyces inusitatus]
MPTLQAAVSVVAPPRKPYASDPRLLSFHRDLVEPFGGSVDESLLRAGPNISHQDLVDHLARAEEIRDAKPDLIVLSHALPDLHPFTAVAPHLNMLLGGGATSTGISQQGLAAPFTALRLVAGYQRGGRCAQAVIAVLEQTTLPTHFPLAHDTPLVDSGVLLLLGTDESEGPVLGEAETLPAGTSPAGRLAALTAADPDGTLVVAGPWVEETGLGPRTHRTDRGTYCTSVWLALARHWRAWRQEYAAVVLCDTDPLSGASHLAVLRGGR